MLSTSRIIRALTIVVLVSLSTVSSAQAALIQLFSPAALDPGDVTHNYPPRPGAFLQPVLPSPFVLNSPPNILTFFEAGLAFARLDQEPSIPPGGGWGGTFPPATRLLYTGNNVDANWFGPITINFALPLREFGLFAQFNDEFFPGPFWFTVFQDALALGTLNMTVGVLPSFLGARTTDADFVTSILIRGPSFLASDNDFAIGPVTAQTIPEPTTLALVGLGLAGAVRAFSARRRQLR